MSVLPISLTGRHTFSARGHDLYETPACATQALLRVERLPKSIWEPCAGRGAIVRILEAAGHQVHASDLIDYGIGIPIADFLSTTRAPADCIVTNPPYRDAAAFVRHALGLCPRVIMLLRLAFLESVGRTDILEGGRLARVHVFRARLPMMHRDGWTGPRTTSAIPFAWFCWDAAHQGPTRLHRISH